MPTISTGPRRHQALRHERARFNPPVAEIYTVQALYGKARAAAIEALPGWWHPAACCW